MIEKSAFFERYNIDFVEFSKISLTWEQLMEIYDHFNGQKEKLYAVADLLAKDLQRLDSVNSVKIRIKNSEHLVEKIVRKLIEDKTRMININTYQNQVTDLIGIRLLHIFKQQQIPIHNYLINNCSVSGTPEAHYRIGDSPSTLDSFIDNECTIKEHKFGYRSIHYCILSKPNLIEYKIEVQVRTIFEEGWSEVDHSINYPRKLEVPYVEGLLSVLNRISGSADEMSGLVFALTDYMNVMKKDFKLEKANNEDITLKIQEKEEEIKNLVKTSSLEGKEKSELQEKLNELTEKIKRLDSKQNLSIFGASTIDWVSLVAGVTENTKDGSKHRYYPIRLKPENPIDKIPIFPQVFCENCKKYYNSVLYPACPICTKPLE